jgi:putative transposase
MPRQSRIVLPNVPTLTLQQALPNIELFRDRRDYETYLSFISETIADFRVSLHAYSLTPGAIYLLLSVPEVQLLARFFQSIGRRYIQHYNARYSNQGSLWRGRFQSSTIESKHYLLEIYRFVDLTATRLQLVAQPEHDLYSSYCHHVGFSTDPRVTDHQHYWQLGNTPFERQVRYREFSIEPTTSAVQKKIGDHLRAGWHLGEAPESLVGRQNGPARRGRPPKQITQALNSVPI